MMMVICKKCRYEHIALGNMEKRSSEKLPTTTYSETCPRYDKISVYHKEDYFFR